MRMRLWRTGWHDSRDTDKASVVTACSAAGLQRNAGWLAVRPLAVAIIRGRPDTRGLLAAVKKQDGRVFNTEGES